MRYWVYINEKVEGPYEETDLVTLQGFTSDTQICTEESASSGEQKWQKASDVFEFDETPAETPEPATTLPLLDTSAPVDIASVTKASTADAAALLKKLDLLTDEMSHLQAKLDSMQTHLDSALEQNKQFAQQAAQTAARQVVQATKRAEKQQEVASDDAKQETTSKIEYPAQQGPAAEDEMVIRSALDSIYGGKVETKKPENEEESFQELLPDGGGKSTDEIAQELEFIPMKEDSSKKEVSEIEEALITTPSLDEASKDALIKELTASPKEDILDQIIQEHQQEEQEAKEQTEKTEKKTSTIVAGLAAAGLTVAGLAKKFTSKSDDKEKTASFKIATDKDNPEKLEDVLPSEQMPADAPAEDKEKSFLDLPGLEDTMHEVMLTEGKTSEEQPAAEPVAEETPAEQPQEPAPAPIDLSGLAEEPVAAISTEEVPQEQPAAEPVAEETPAEQPQEPEPAPIDLSGLAEEPVAAISTEEVPQEQPAAEPVVEETPAEQPQEPEPAPLDLSGLAEEPAPETPAAEPVAEETPAPGADLPGLDSVSAPLPQAEQVQEEAPAAIANLPGLDSIGQPEPEPVVPEPQVEQTPDWQEDTIQELVPQRTEEKAEEFVNEEAQTPIESQSGSIEEVPASEPTAAEKPAQPALEGVDLSVPLPAANSAAAEEDAPVDNPNDLTEIELKEGSTYLISDFVPPAQLTDDVAAIMNSTKKNLQAEEEGNKKSETAFQDMLAATTMQRTTPLATDGLPEDVAATAVNLENTIQARRGPSMDIKTVPVVPEPGKTDRLPVDDLNDVNAQHDVKRSGSNSTKMIVGGLVGVLLLVILYGLLGLMHILPDSINLFAGKKSAAQPAATVTGEAAATQELLPETEAPAEEAQEEESSEPDPIQVAQMKVQEFPLPNGYLLAGFISSKHPLASIEDIAWSTTEAVEADNYSVSVKVPPENPQSLQTAYRFNYNMKTGILNPTNSDAKNLLDQAYGKVQEPAKKTTSTKKKAGTKKNRRR